MFTARYVLHSTFCPHSVFMCFVWIWEQTAIISLYSINWLVFITELECVYCVVHSTFCPHRVFMCFVWILEQTAVISLYSIDWLVFMTESCLLVGTAQYVLVFWEFNIVMNWSHDSKVTVVIRLWLGKYGVQFLAGTGFSLLQNVETDSVTRPVSVLNDDHR